MTVAEPATTADPGDLQTVRGDALERAATIALPTKRDEAWRYAPFATLKKLEFGSTASTPQLNGDLDAPELGGPRVVLVNGVIDSKLSDFESLPAGLRIEPLTDVTGRPVPLTPRFGDRSAVSDDAFVLLNTAHARDGLVISVEPNTEIEPVIQIVSVSVPGQVANTSASKVIIDIGEGASGTVVETRLGEGDAFGGSSVRTSIALAERARLEHIVLQGLPPTQVHLGVVEVVQRGGSEFRARSFNLGAEYGRCEYTVVLDGEEARAELSGLYVGHGSQTLDQQLTVVHAAPNCVSRQIFRGVLDDSSTGVFSGGVDVRPGADGTDSEQANDNLVLSRKAEADSQPRLEILADEVVCKHGATVGQLDEQALYYMRTRGIPAEEAGRLLVNGFADQVMDDLDIAPVRAWINHRLGRDALQEHSNDA